MASLPATAGGMRPDGAGTYCRVRKVASQAPAPALFAGQQENLRTAASQLHLENARMAFLDDLHVVTMPGRACAALDAKKRGVSSTDSAASFAGSLWDAEPWKSGVLAHNRAHVLVLGCSSVTGLQSIGLHVLSKGLQQQDLPLTLGLRPLCDRIFPFVVLPVALPAHRNRVKFYHAVIPTISPRTTATTTGALERCACDVVSMLAQHDAAIMQQHGQGGKQLVGKHPLSCNGSWQSRLVRPCFQAPGTLNPVAFPWGWRTCSRIKVCGARPQAQAGSEASLDGLRRLHERKHRFRHRSRPAQRRLSSVKCPKPDVGRVPYSALAPSNYNHVCADEHLSIISRAWTSDRMIGNLQQNRGPRGRRNLVFGKTF